MNTSSWLNKARKLYRTILWSTVFNLVTSAKKSVKVALLTSELEDTFVLYLEVRL